MVEKYIRYLYYSLFFFVPLLMFPFTSELFEFNKMIFIYTVAILVSGLWIYQMDREKRLIFKRTPLDIPILLFLGSQILATVFSIDILTSLYGYYGRFNGGLLSTLSYIVLFYGLVTFSHVFKREKILKLSLASSFVAILWGLPGRLGFDLTCWAFTQELGNSCWTDQFRPQERMFSTLGQPNWFGAFLVVNFFIAAYFFLREKGRKNLLYLGYLSLNFLGVIFSRSRSALLALVTGLIIFGAYYYLTNKKNKDFPKFLKTKVAPLLAIFLVIVLIFKTGVARIDKLIDFQQFSQKKTEQVEKKPVQAPVSSEVSESFDIRKIVWKGAIDLGLKYPMFGTGVETFAYSYYFTRPPEHNLTSEWDYLYNKAHNEYLNYLATTGFIGLGTYLLLIGWIIFKLISQLRKEKNLIYVSLLCAYLAILITNFFGFSTTTISIYFYLLPALLIKGKEVKNPRFFVQNNRYLTMGGLLITGYLLFSVVQYYMADLKYADSQGYARLGDYQTSSTLLDEALKLKKEHVYEDKLSSSLANWALFSSAYQKDTDLTTNFAGLAESYNAESLQSSPKNVLYWKTKVKNHYLFYQIDLDEGQLKEGFKALDEAEKYSPTDPKIPYTRAIFYSLMEDEAKGQDKIQWQEKALAEIDKSLKLKPDFRDGLLLKGQLLKKYGNREEANKIFNKLLRINPDDKEVLEELNSL